MKPDYRKTHLQIYEDWKSCRKCTLGEYRDATESEVVFGQGSGRGGILFVSEGPGLDELAAGVPVAGANGSLLQHVIKKFEITNYYITNAVICRSCAQQYDTEGNPMTWKDRTTGLTVPRIRDQPPTPAQMEACRDRLYEEIYFIDPAIIIALGKHAADTLARRPVTMPQESGTPITIKIPGAGSHAKITEKKKQWARRLRKVELIMPIEPNVVEYLMVPIPHPSFVISRQVDQRNNNPVSTFVQSLKKALSIYAAHRLEVYGDAITVHDLTEADVLEVLE